MKIALLKNFLSLRIPRKSLLDLSTVPDLSPRSLSDFSRPLTSADRCLRTFEWVQWIRTAEFKYGFKLLSKLHDV